MARGHRVIDWVTVLAEGVRIVRSYTTVVTLRQLHYRLVAASVGGYVNTTSAYKTLSAKTAEARRTGSFPTLADTGRMIHRPARWLSPASLLRAAASQYRRDRTEGQEHQVWMLYEKATLSAQMQAWTSPYGLPVAALRGYSSESLERDIFAEMVDDGRPVVVFYVGDLDPEGEDIERNFVDQAERMDVDFEHWQRLGVTPAQIGDLGLVENPGKSTSSRAPGFVAKYGRLFQIELEAIDPAVLERLVIDEVTGAVWHDDDAYDDVLARENRERARLKELADAE